MMKTKWEPRKGDPCVAVTERQFADDTISPLTTVHRITDTLVVTADGERYRRGELYPIKGGRYSPTVLRSVHDPIVIAIRARSLLTQVVRHAENLRQTNPRTAEDVVGLLAQIVADASETRQAVLGLMREATNGAP